MFLPGQDDIQKAVKMLNEGVASLPADACMDLLVLPIYAALPPDLQVLPRPPRHSLHKDHCHGTPAPHTANHRTVKFLTSVVCASMTSSAVLNNELRA